MGANKTLKNADIAAMTAKDIEAKIKEERAEMQRLKFTQAVASLENPLILRAKRRNIARMVTALNNTKKA